MENFTLYNPTKLHFGHNVLNDLSKTLAKYGKRVLLVYGKNSIKENGIYTKVISQLKSMNAEVSEYTGIKSNPVIEDVDFAARLGRNNNVDVILAVGGGSVIDSTKIISITIPVSHSGWDFYSGMNSPVKAVPMVAVLTLAATGTEMNPFAVLQNHKTKQKLGWGNPLCYPKHSFLDPEFTITVPRNYTAYGIGDLIAHCLEAYFGKGDASLSDKIVFSIIREAMENGPALLDDLKNYELREKILYASTLALNGITFAGRAGGDWGVHDIGHVLSLLFDTPHGASLSIVYPAWMKVMKYRIPDRINQLGDALFGSNNPDTTILKFEELFRKIGCPVRLEEAGIQKKERQHILDVMRMNKVSGMHQKLTTSDVEQILDSMFQ